MYSNNLLFVTDDLFYICVEQTLINDGTNDIVQAFCQCFALYYVLNLKYPANFSMTFEFIQRHLLKINPEEGSKTSKSSLKTHSILNKVLRLLNKLRNA